MTDQGPFALHIGTLVSEEDGRPWVTIQVIGTQPNGNEVMVAAMKLSPEEARQQGHSFYQAAEAAEASANLVLSLREQKIPEEQVMAVFTRMKERRGRY